MAISTTEIQELLKKAKGSLFGKGDANAQFKLGTAYVSMSMVKA